MTTEQIMQARKTAAVEAITAELWKDHPDAESMADHAIKGGLDAATVSQLESKAKDAQALLDAVDGLDVCALQSEADKLAKSAAAAQRKADEAQEKATEAQDVAADAATEIEQAKQKFQLAAQSAQRGEIPSERLPETCKRILECNKAVDRAQQADQAVRQAHYDRQRFEGALADAQRDLDRASRDKGHGMGSQTVTPGGLVDAVTTAKTAVKRLTDALKTLKKSQPKLKREAAEAAAAMESARLAITA